MARSVQVPAAFEYAMVRPAATREAAQEYSAALAGAWTHRGTDPRARVVARTAVRRLRQLRTLREGR